MTIEEWWKTSLGKAVLFILCAGIFVFVWSGSGIPQKHPITFGLAGVVGAVLYYLRDEELQEYRKSLLGVCRMLVLLIFAGTCLGATAVYMLMPDDADEPHVTRRR